MNNEQLNTALCNMRKSIDAIKALPPMSKPSEEHLKRLLSVVDDLERSLDIEAPCDYERKKVDRLNYFGGSWDTSLVDDTK